MNNRKIPTHYGVLIIVMIALTVGVFISQYKKNRSRLEEQSANQQLVEKRVENNQNLETTENINWLTFKNDKYNFKIQYPSNFLFDEDLIDGPEYSANFGPSYKETFGKEHSVRKAARNFEISIRKNESGIDNLIKKQNAIGIAVEQKSELIGTEKVGGVLGKIVKMCDIGGYCNKIIYFTHDKYIYSIYMQNYFTLKDGTDKNNFDRMIASFEFLPKQ